MTIGLVASIANGIALPAFAIVFGSITDSLNPSNGPDEIVRQCGIFALYFLGLGAISFICSYLSFATWMIAGERQGIEYRKHYLRSLICQEIGFFDAINPNELSSKIANECFAIQGAIGEKVATFVFAFSMMISGFVIGFLKGWQLALVLCACIPVLGISGSLFVVSIQKSTTFSSESYNKAGAIAEESINGIRTVVALGGIEREVNRYKDTLLVAKKQVIKFGFFSGIALGLIFFAMMATYALGFWFGSKLIEDRTINPVTDEPYGTADVMACFFSVLFGAFSTSQTTPCVKAFALGKQAAAKAFKVIDKKSQIDVTDPNGDKPETVAGEIKFENVKFAYPLKPDRTILDGISFVIRPNEKTAFVGESGCGKTTCMQLIERFYDILGGSITLDGKHLKDLNLRWLRNQIGYVGQEPVLFATSIRENLLFARESATDDEIWDALKKANAYQFVSHLPKQLDTYVGTSGAQLSGGQKQRLAIARAILKNPRILLLDEATSALDRKNELEIQQTLDQISVGRTTIVIAHRLTTIQNSDHIIVFDQGKIVEEGVHKELFAKKGRYYELNLHQVHGLAAGINDQQASNKDAPDLSYDPKSPSAGMKVPVERFTVSKPDGGEKVEINVDLDGTTPHAKKISELEVKATDEAQKEVVSNDDVLIPSVEEKKLSPQEEAAKKKAEEKEKKALEKAVMSRLFAINKSEKGILILAIFICLANGTIFPLFSIILSDMLEVFTDYQNPEFRSRADNNALFFFICAIAALILNTLQLGLMGHVGESLTMKLRTSIFFKLLKMDIAWFDKPENSPGALATKLSTDCTLVNSLTSSTLGISLQSISSLITGMVIAFIASWQLTLVALGLTPLMMFAAKIQAAFNQGFSAANDGPYKESAGFITEAVTNMRTVASFGREDNLLKSYNAKLDPPLRAAVKKGNGSGLAFGLSQFVMFGTYAVIFYVGALFTRDENIKLSFKNMFQSIFGVMFAAFGSGNAAQFAPDAGAAKAAAINLFKILDHKPDIDIDEQNKLKTPIKGDIEFKNVWFKYPSRNKHVLQGVSFKIKASSKVAFVGPSGCGKSTIMSLLLRYYTIESGEIYVDGHKIEEYDISHLRASFGVVSQEPLLFNGTIEYNIKYSRENATDDEMKDVARRANALGFIENNEFDSLDPNDQAKFGTGFKRMVGPKGSQISGGQKQRIAIARALLNQPNVLLLDEATSALDTQNEKVVQESLDKIMQGKTSIVVAHRISTIRDSDQIYVFSEGKIVENGTYEELTKKEGVFYRLERGIDV